MRLVLKTYVQQVISKTTASQPVIQGRVEHLIFACEGQLICVATHCLRVIEGWYSPGASRRLHPSAVIFEYSEGIQNKIITPYSLADEFKTGIVCW